MEIRLLKSGYKKSEQFYKDFLDDNIKNNDDYFSGEVVNIDVAPDFPIYMGVGYDKCRDKMFKEAFEIMENKKGLAIKGQTEIYILMNYFGIHCYVFIRESIY